MITGGTGSFGNAVLKRFMNTDIKEIRIFSRDEKKQEDMRISLRNDKVKFYLGDARDFRSIDNAMEGVDYIFHAAALKQVPSCEFYPMEAVRTNILGTENVLEAAIKHRIEKIICLGTDKAVYPINAMGISKAMMEKVAISKARLHTKPLITCTRYGNVMASRGSVIPLFISQIKAGKPLTITDPEMTRFMMSLDNAVELVLYAYENAHPGDIFVQKAPAATIMQLAQVLQEIFSATNDIQVIGPRHGEKLYETLLTREEYGKAKDEGGYFRIPSDDRDLNYAKYFSEGNSRVAQSEDYHSHNTYRLTNEELRDMLLALDYVQEQLTATPEMLVK